jgi:dynein heavy chain, axonemal
MTTHLLTVQPKYRNELFEQVTSFRMACQQFSDDYEQHGPNVSGLTPRESSNRQIVFHSRVEHLYKQYETYYGGEQLFGLPVNEYPRLHAIRRDLLLLQRLYNLYNRVLDTVANYYDLAWIDVNIERINHELADFQVTCRQLPRDLREFPAYHTLKKTIDDFSQCK